MGIKGSYSCIPVFNAARRYNLSPSFGRRVALVGIAIFTIPVALIEAVARLALTIFGGVVVLLTPLIQEVREFTKEMGVSCIRHLASPVTLVALAINPKSLKEKGR